MTNWTGYKQERENPVTPVKEKRDAAVTPFVQRVSSIADRLQLTQEDVGSIVGASGRTVNRWHTGDAVPQRTAKQRLIHLAYVAEALAEVLRPEDANLWIFAPNRLLDHDSPADRIKNGDYRSVLRLIDALAEGVVA